MRRGGECEGGFRSSGKKSAVRRMEWHRRPPPPATADPGQPPTTPGGATVVPVENSHRWGQGAGKCKRLYVIDDLPCDGLVGSALRARDQRLMSRHRTLMTITGTVNIQSG